jgi:hypothetical protein
MSRRPANFVQADISRAIRAAQAAGPGWFIEVLPGGTIRIAQSLAADRAPPGREPQAGLAPEHNWRL